MAFSIPWESLFGGVLLGISATLMLLFNGKIAGISGVLTGLMTPKTRDFAWRLLFALGMVSGGVLGVLFFSAEVPQTFTIGSGMLVLAGLLVGIGTRLGNGCTSGHGICGIGRLSPRSIVATCVFMVVAAMTVFVRLHLS
ncbi:MULTISPECIES: YeeE/YedE family protein [Vibrio]|uniref:Membrane protein n=1 Tax=Vibrio aestuarianus TaxID=28171 RepID=A0A7X6N9F8_9VIBR|nr:MULTISPECIES: YeeE/YedE family protein [Vibrio]MDE1211625.1 YeeE/YedE family protein [Vibrio aestuarianus]MDE1214498.1 YeeE/YedE family protein [Vibrio aestuarianus]MDE1219268.1 YeeE/YedE family protein [Vibrio aestuarianus]MDE1229455.1 YeeE/YedE family protein [Vibrio aestuarianus]MDE1230034.1 YeeE/YedE family protein [Vibrio aestuarianus]